MFRAVAISALFSQAALALVSLLPVQGTIAPGATVTISWTQATGPATLILREGDPNNLKTITTITSGATGSSFAWHVPSDITFPSGTDYAIEIQAGSETNFISGVTVNNPSGKAAPSSSSSETTTHKQSPAAATESASSETTAAELSAEVTQSATESESATGTGAEATATDTGSATETATESASEAKTVPSGAAVALSAGVPACILGAIAAFAL